MDNINKDMARMVAEMREVGELPAPSKGGSHNNLLRYNEMRERILEKFLSAFDAGYTLTPPNEWVSVEETKPEPGERVIATDGAFVGEGYMDCYGVWCRPNGMRWDMLDSEVTHWMPISEPPDRRPPEGEA